MFYWCFYFSQVVFGQKISSYVWTYGTKAFTSISDERAFKTNLTKTKSLSCLPLQYVTVLDGDTFFTKEVLDPESVVTRKFTDEGLTMVRV